MTTESFEDEYDEYDGFDDDDDERGVSGLVVLLIILAMLLAFSFIVWLAYNKGIRQGSADGIPQIAADPEPIKTVTNTANDTNSANNSVGADTNREVYDRIDGRTETRTEVLGEGPEEPINQQSTDIIGNIAAAASNEVENATQSVATVASNATNDAVNTISNVTEDTVSNAEEALQDTVSALSESTPSYNDQQTNRLDSVIESALNESNETSNTSASTTPISSAPVTSPSSRGTHVVQVGAFRTEAEADAFWGRLNNRFEGFLDGKSKDIERADLGSRGIFYRLRIAGFDSKDDANQYCSGLKARSQDCLVKAR